MTTSHICSTSVQLELELTSGMISAIQIARWATTNLAQGELPRLVRRLIHTNAKTTELAMPAGDSVSLPGFDGELDSELGNAWIPIGRSCWELSCRADILVKANEDYAKRSKTLLPQQRLTRTYVALTARRWAAKTRWREEKCAEGLWKDVRAYDADDLEQWLEQSPAVALAFSEQLGLSGPGVETLDAYLKKWCTQCSPGITPNALLTGRAEQASQLTDRIRRACDGASSAPLAIKADSIEEAAAFAAAAIIEDGALATVAVVVTSADGWRFTEANEGIGIAVAASPSIAESPAARDRLALVVPYASDDMARQFRGAGDNLNGAEIILDRALPSDFEKALQLIGLDENDTRRLSNLCGRSWSVFRRQHSINPAIRRPAWLDHPAVNALATLCLVGGWSTDKDADIKIVERLSGRVYAELEADLLALERLDDSPLLHIGAVWKAKSALELLAIFGERITPTQLDRYFAELASVLSAPDPQLELEDHQRYAAAIHGKVRPISGLLLNSLCDTLVKLAVRGADIPALAANGIQRQIDHLVRSLLRGADRVRWLSLANQLPALAEASPHEFLTAVETGIATPSGGALAVFLETKGPGFASCCWHAGMLWALETLAWAPNRLRRVSLILARLRAVEIRGNWANTPANSLLDLYRSWFPQTAATVEQRIAVIDDLIEHFPDAAFALLDSITSPGMDTASPTSRPKWRDDDAGAGYGATGLDRHRMEIAALDRQIDMSSGDAMRIAKIIPKYSRLDSSRRQRILTLLNDCVSLNDDEKEILRAALRNKLNWHYNYDDRNDDTVRALLEPLEAAYGALEPTDRIIRDAWLFKSGWVELPVRSTDETPGEYGRRSAALARSALTDLFDRYGWAGIERLAASYGDPWTIGSHLPFIDLPADALCHWIIEQAGDLRPGKISTTITASMFCWMSPEYRNDALDAIFDRAGSDQGAIEWLARLLTLCPHDPAIWRRAEKIGQSQNYWSNCTNALLLDDNESKAFALGKLVEHRRPLSALHACHGKFAGYEPDLVMAMLEGVARGEEFSKVEMPQSYVFERAIDFLENCETVEEMRLVQLEFVLIRALGFGGELHAQTLYRVLMSRPEVYVELLCLAYMPQNGPKQNIDVEQRSAAENALHVLCACQRQPGADEDGSIDANVAASFMHETRRLAAEQDRLEVCDITLGEIFAHSSDGADGIWPGESARSLIENSGSEDMLRGLYTGTLNKRGMTSRGAYEGGHQERELANYFRKNALALECSHPQLAATILEIANSYERRGIFEDRDARLRIERS